MPLASSNCWGLLVTVHLEWFGPILVAVSASYSSKAESHEPFEVGGFQRVPLSQLKRYPYETAFTIRETTQKRTLNHQSLSVGFFGQYHSPGFFFGHFEKNSRWIPKKLKQFSPQNSSKFVENSIICQLNTIFSLHLFSFGKKFQKYCPKT